MKITLSKIGVDWLRESRLVGSVFRLLCTFDVIDHMPLIKKNETLWFHLPTAVWFKFYPINRIETLFYNYSFLLEVICLFLSFPSIFLGTLLFQFLKQIFKS